MLTGKQFTLNKSSFGIETVTGGLARITITTGEIVEVVSGPIDGDRMVDVLCKGRSIAMFAIDLKTRGVEVMG